MAYYRKEFDKQKVPRPIWQEGRQGPIPDFANKDAVKWSALSSTGFMAEVPKPQHLFYILAL